MISVVVLNTYITQPNASIIAVVIILITLSNHEKNGDQKRTTIIGILHLLLFVVAKFSFTWILGQLVTSNLRDIN